MQHTLLLKFAEHPRRAAARLNRQRFVIAQLQRLMQREPDLLLDEVAWNGSQWLVRSRHHARYSLDPEKICLADKPGKRLRQYVEACGQSLALAHGRTDHRSNAFETAIAARIADSGDTLIETARAYSQRVIADHALLQSMQS